VYDASAAACHPGRPSALGAAERPPADGGLSIQEQLEAAVCLPLPTPLIVGGPRLRRSRTPASVQMLRRSGRIAAMPRAPNTTLQAQRLLLKKLGVRVQEDAPELDIEAKIRSAFRASNLTSYKKRCLSLLLNGGPGRGVNGSRPRWSGDRLGLSIVA
jgi:hypothetical protein